MDADNYDEFGNYIGILYVLCQRWCMAMERWFSWQPSFSLVARSRVLSRTFLGPEIDSESDDVESQDELPEADLPEEPVEKVEIKENAVVLHDDKKYL